MDARFVARRLQYYQNHFPQWLANISANANGSASASGSASGNGTNSDKDSKASTKGAAAGAVGADNNSLGLCLL